MPQFEISARAAVYVFAVGVALIVTSFVLPCATLDNFWRAVVLSNVGCMLCGAALLGPSNRAVLGAVLGFFFSASIAAFVMFLMMQAGGD
jgi:hypothetical protein